MRTKDWTKAAVMAGALCLAGWAAYGQQSSSQQTGDPVADAARKAREEKKNAQKPKKVYTDDDVKPATPGKPDVQNASAATGATSGTQGAAASTAAAGTQKAEDATNKEDATKEDPNSEKAWRKRFSEQHAKIAKAEKELDILQRELQKSQVQYYADPTKAMNEQNNRTEINGKTAKIAAKQKELDALRQELDDMETQLRKAGGDPGWAQ
jgi:chromosome segregation ATPase